MRKQYKSLDLLTSTNEHGVKSISSVIYAIVGNKRNFFAKEKKTKY